MLYTVLQKAKVDDFTINITLTMFMVVHYLDNNNSMIIVIIFQKGEKKTLAKIPSINL